MARLIKLDDILKYPLAAKDGRAVLYKIWLAKDRVRRDLVLSAQGPKIGMAKLGSCSIS